MIFFRFYIYSLAAVVIASSISVNLALAADASADAVAVRVLPNSEHYSPAYWYKKNVKVQGAPQALLVDGYEAVRDGRTVYVNAGNIDSGKLYTNVYAISYNQAAEPSTVDIFGQFLVHWRFNVNPDISAAQKQKIIRDVKRLADLRVLNDVLTAHKTKPGGAAPALISGSYLAGKSVSIWPSWQATLGAALGISLPLDPVNRLADCPGYSDKNTCWNQTEKTFYFNFNRSAADALSVAHSPVYWYDGGQFYVSLETNYNLTPSVANAGYYGTP